MPEYFQGQPAKGDLRTALVCVFLCVCLLNDHLALLVQGLLPCWSLQHRSMDWPSLPALRYPRDHLGVVKDHTPYLRPELVQLGLGCYSTGAELLRYSSFFFCSTLKKKKSSKTYKLSNLPCQPFFSSLQCHSGQSHCYVSDISHSATNTARTFQLPR